AAPAAGRAGADGLHVFERAVGQAAGPVRALDGWDEGVGSRGDDQFVVGVELLVRDVDAPPLAVDPGGPRVPQHGDAVLAEEILVGQRQVLRAGAIEALAEPYPVVGRAGF